MDRQTELTTIACWCIGLIGHRCVTSTLRSDEADLDSGTVCRSMIFRCPAVAGFAMGIGAMSVVILPLPLTSVLLATLILGSDGLAVMPLVIVAVVVALVAAGREPSPGQVAGLSLAFWTATAFSPTDVSAIKRWAKLLMIMEAAVPLSIGALVIARAINILK
jgi:hypothetical protein